MFAASVIASVLLLAPSPEDLIVPRSFADLLESCEYRYTGGQYQEELFRYRLFVPRDPKPQEKYPLLVWFHGYGEHGLDNQISLKYLNTVILKDLGHLEKYRFFILVVQCPPSNSNWFRSSGAGPAAADDMLSVTYAILQKTLGERPVDQDRVYLAGVSAGGGACWEMATRYPEVFTAVVPMSSGGGDVSRAAKLVDIPIWAFHNDFDKGTPPEGDARMVAAVKRAGGNAHLTLFPSGSHFCWDDAFHQCDAMAWMLGQRRDASLCWTPAGCRPWKWWHVFGVPGVFLALVGAGWYSERRRRMRQKG